MYFYNLNIWLWSSEYSILIDKLELAHPCFKIDVAEPPHFIRAISFYAFAIYFHPIPSCLNLSTH